MELMERISLMSAGTMSNLTGLTKYDDIYEVKGWFRDFAETLPQSLTWQTAWNKYVENLWSQLENISVDKKADRLDQDFFIWKKGEYVHTIWSWFNTKYYGGIDALGGRGDK